MPPFSKLGLDLLDADFTGDYVVEALKGRTAPCKAALLDQALFAGVGNWIADEALYQTGTHPATRCCDCSEEQARALHKALVDIVQFAVGVSHVTRLPGCMLPAPQPL